MCILYIYIYTYPATISSTPNLDAWAAPPCFQHEGSGKHAPDGAAKGPLGCPMKGARFGRDVT